MTEAERKKRGEKSAVIVGRLVRAQLRAMKCERFDLGIRRDAGEMILREGQGAIEIKEAIKWLRHENGKGAHIYIRPAGTHSLSLIDDLTADSIERMRADGFEPAVVVETSLNKLPGVVESRPGPRSRDEHACSEGPGRAVRRGSSERGLEAFRTTRGIHQPEARAAVAIRDAAIRAFAISDRTRLLARSRVPCRHHEK